MPNRSFANASRRPSLRLMLLTALVLLAHWAVLSAAPVSLAAHASQDPVEVSWSFSTRTVAAEELAPMPGQAVKPAAALTERERRSAQPKPAQKPAPGKDNAGQPSAVLAENGETTAKEIASQDPHDAPVPDAPVLLADAGAPAGKTGGTAPDNPRTASAKPLPAKAVRGFVIPPTTRLKYDIKGEVKGFPYQVNAELRWAQDGKSYDARMEISHFLLGSRVQTSTGQLTRFGLEPTRFGDKVRSEVAAHFDYEKNKVTFSANTPDAPLLPGAQDQLSVFMQLAAMFGADPKGFPQGSTLPFQAVGPRSADSWVFTVGAMEKLQMPGGDISAVRLWRDPNGEHDAKGEIWLAPELGYLPVRIRLTQPNGDFVDQQWRETLR
jgi:hypothetical protein